MMSSGLPPDKPGSTTPADWVNWPTFSSMVIRLSRACARSWAFGLKGNVWEFADATANRKKRADATTRADWSAVGERWKNILLRLAESVCIISHEGSRATLNLASVYLDCFQNHRGGGALNGRGETEGTPIRIVLTA